MKVKFIADDGSLFSSEEECKEYEEAMADIKEKKKAYEEALKAYYKKFGSANSLFYWTLGVK